MQSKDKETFPEILGDMAELSEEFSRKIKDYGEKDNIPYVNYEKALEKKNENEYAFLLGLIGKYLETTLEIPVFIEWEINYNFNPDDLTTAIKTLRYLSYGFLIKEKLIMSFPTKLPSKVLRDPEENKAAAKAFKSKMLTDYSQLSESNFVVRKVFEPEKLKFFLIPVKIGDLVLDGNHIAHFKKYASIFNKDFDPDFKDDKPIMETIILSKEIFPKYKDPKDGSKFENDEKKETRGGEPYYPPVGWTRYAVRTNDLYDYDKIDKTYDNTWSSNDENKSWCVAYVGLRNEDIEEKVKEFENDNDLKNDGKKVGLGAIVYPRPEDMEADCVEIEYGNEKYKIGFMLRVNPKAIRIPESGKRKYWVVSGTYNDLRPCFILCKKIN